MNLLDVYFHNKKIGVLKEHNSRLSFKYSDDATESIAHQLPLQKEAFGDKETRSFFSNLLPKGDVVKKIAQIKQVSLNNPFALLREYCSCYFSANVAFIFWNNRLLINISTFFLEKSKTFSILV